MHSAAVNATLQLGLVFAVHVLLCKAVALCHSVSFGDGPNRW